MTSFFATTADSATRLPDLLETFASGIDLATPVDALATALQHAGFIDVEVRSIGEDVWPGWDRWIAGTGYRDSWSRNWLVAAQQACSTTSSSPLATERWASGPRAADLLRRRSGLTAPRRQR